MKTKIEIINETVEFYSANPLNRRAISQNDGCQYLTSDGRKCAIGRLIKDDKYDKKFEGRCCDNDYYIKLEDILMDEYKGHSTEFWSGLQSLHDSSKFWYTDRLSIEGEKRVQELLLKYK